MMTVRNPTPGVRSAQYGLWAGLGVAVGLLAIYIATLMPGVPPTDSGELALAAWTGGVAHAPGFPLYTALGWLWTHLLPLGRVIWRLNLLSALCGAVAGGLLFVFAQRTLREADAHPSATVLAAATGALAFGLGRTVWNWATVAEVYTLNLALTAAILLLVIASGGALYEERRSGGTASRPGNKRTTQHVARPVHPVPRPAPLLTAAFLFGLGLGGHLTSIALLAPALAFWLTARHGWRFWLSKTVFLAALALLAGAAIYLYLPGRAAADPWLNWGQPDTWQRFWWHITAKQFRVSLFSAPVGPQVVIAAKLWWTQFTPVGLILLGIGAWRMARTQRPLFWMLLLVIVCVTFYAWAYVIEDDGDAYYLPAFLAGAVWVAWGARTILKPKLMWIPLVCGVGAALALNWGACDRHADTIPEDYVRDAFSEIGQGGLLLTRDWQFYGPALYLQQIEELRPDVTVIDTELLRRDWYFGLLHRTDPELMATVATEEQDFRSLRDAWERGDLPEGDPRLGQLQVAYEALLNTFLAQGAAAGRPIHIGPNRGAEPLRNATLNGQPDMEAGIGAAWQWLPVGLSFRAMPAGAPITPAAPLSWYVASFDQVRLLTPERKIQATRADMAALHGLVQANLGNLAGAEADWLLALKIDPAHAPAAELLQRLRSQP